jgi:di/tricarboxylate transporter
VALITLVFFVLTIVISVLRKSNTGIIGLGFAIILAIMTNTPWRDVVSKFPTSVFVTIIGVTAFFAYFLENGTITWASRAILYRFRNTRKALPFVLFFIALILGATGGPSSAGFIAALVFPVAYGAGLHPIHAAIITLSGANCGANMPFGQFGAVVAGILSGVNDGIYVESMLKVGWSSFFLQFISYLLMNTVLYFVFRCYKISGTLDIEPPPPLTEVQKKSLINMVIVLCFVIFPPILAKIFPDPSIKKFAGYCDITLVCFLGCVVNLFMSLGDESNVIKRVPWGSGIMIAGMGMLVGVASALGVIDLLSNALSGVPPFLMTSMLMITAGIMSTFASSMSVVFPTMLPIAGAIALASGANPIMYFSAVITGSLTTAISPLSTGVPSFTARVRRKSIHRRNSSSVNWLARMRFLWFWRFSAPLVCILLFHIDIIRRIAILLREHQIY